MLTAMNVTTKAGSIVAVTPTKCTPATIFNFAKCLLHVSSLQMVIFRELVVKLQPYSVCPRIWNTVSHKCVDALELQ